METLIIIGSAAVIGATLYPILKQMPFAYGVTRIRASKGQLFSSHELRAMATDPYKEILYKLERRGYSDLLETAGEDFDEEKVQHILRSRELSMLQKLAKVAPKRYKNFFGMLIQKHEIENLLALLRSKINPNYQQHVLDDIIISTPYFPKEKHSTLIAMSLHEFMEYLENTPYHSLVKRYEADLSKRSMSTLETEFNKQFFEQLSQSSQRDKILRNYTSLLIDVHNIKQALNFSTLEAITGGTLKSKVLDKLAACKNLQAANEALKGTRYALDDANTVREAQKLLLVKQVQYAKQLRGSQQFSIAPFISHYIEQSVQLKNIRIILNLSSAGFDARFIEKAII